MSLVFRGREYGRPTLGISNTLSYAWSERGFCMAWINGILHICHKKHHHHNGIPCANIKPKVFLHACHIGKTEVGTIDQGY